MNLWSEVVVGAQFTMDIAKCFNSSSKKRDVSDQSCNGEEPKKVREGSLNDSNVSLDDVLLKVWSQLSVYMFLSIAWKILRLK